MSGLDDQADMEAELIKRNREIAKVRDDLLKAEKRLEESKMRNDDLLEKVSELDAEANKKMARISELEAKVEEVTSQVEEKAAELGELRKEHCENMEKLRKELEEEASTAKLDTAAQDELNKKVADLEASKDQVMKDLEQERKMHNAAKVSLETSESANRDNSSRLLETRRQIKELEEKLADSEASRNASLAEGVQRSSESEIKFQTELAEVKMQAEMDKSLREDLETQLRESEGKLDIMRVKLDDAQAQIADHGDRVSSLEQQRDEAETRCNDMKATIDDAMTTERKRMQDSLQKAMQQAADNEGRLGGQRVILDETTEALTKSEQEEEKLRRELEDKDRDFEKEREALKAAQDEANAQAEQEAKAMKSRFANDLETAEVAARHHARSEIDAAEREALAAADRHRTLESEMAQMRLDHEETMAQHQRLEGSAKSQSAEMKTKIHETEEKILNLEQEIERLREDLKEKGLESERVTVAHKLECERLQQTLEVEGNARAAAEKISQSKLEEKDTLIEHRDSKIEYLGHDLEDAKKKIASLEEQVVKEIADGEAKGHQLGMRNAQLEGELRSRQDRLTEAEGRLEAQRAYLEEVTETLNKTKDDKDGLLQAKGSLETQLRLEATHRDAMNNSLQQQADDSEKRCRDLEERILKDRDAHKDQIEEVRRSVGEELKQGAERLAAVEAELLTARQRCELLSRNKADLLQEVAEHNSNKANIEAKVKEQQNKTETLSLELDQVKSAKETLEQDLATLREEKRQGDSRVNELTLDVKKLEEAKDALQDDFKLKIQRLDDLLNEERKLRQGVESALGNARSNGETLSAESMNLRRKMEQELIEAKTTSETWKDRADDLQLKLTSTKEQLDSQKARTEEIDSQRRELESQLRGDLATSEARLRRLEQEVQREKTEVENGKATLAETQATMTAKISALEKTLNDKQKESRLSDSAKDQAEKQMKMQSDSHGQLTERVSMQAEELFTRQVEFALEKQRLSGALEESRRTLRNSLAVPQPSAAIDTARVNNLEKQLAEERRKSIEQAVALQRAERKSGQLEDANKRSEEHRAAAVQSSREAERRCTGLSEELRKAQIKQTLTDQKCDETRERASMSSAEIQTVKYVSKYETAKLRGHLEELRYMIKKSEQSQRR